MNNSYWQFPYIPRAYTRLSIYNGDTTVDDYGEDRERGSGKTIPDDSYLLHGPPW